MFVVSAVEGVEVQTEVAWRLAEARGIPRAIFVNKLDRERASFERTLDELKDTFGAGIAPLELPIGEEAEFRGVVDLLTDKAVTYDGDRQAARPGPIPDDMATEEHAVHDALVEGIVVADDDLMERYLADETDRRSTSSSTRSRRASPRRSVFPVLCGERDASSIGIDRLAHFIVEEGPAPDGRRRRRPPRSCSRRSSTRTSGA